MGLNIGETDKVFTLIFAVFVEKLYQIRLHCLILWRRYDQNNLVQYGRRRHVKFTSGLHFDTFSRLGRQNASAYKNFVQIDNILQSYDVSYIFKMASVRHLDFWKIQILDKFSRAESKSASAHQIWSKSDDRRPRYCDKTEIQYGRRHVEFTSGLHFDTFSRLGRQNVSAYKISCKLVNILRSYDVSYIFKMASVRHLKFWRIQILDQIFEGRVIICVGTPNLVKIGWSAAEILR